MRPLGAWGPVGAPGGAQIPAAGQLAQWVLYSSMTFAAMFCLGAFLIGTWVGVLVYALVFLAAGGGLCALGQGLMDRS